MAESKKKKSSKPKGKKKKGIAAASSEKKRTVVVGNPPPPVIDDEFAVEIEDGKVRGTVTLQARGHVLEEVNPQERLAGLFGKGATDLELDLAAIGKATPGPWEVSFGYEQSDPGCFIAGQGIIVAAEQDDTDCVLRQADADFMARARTRLPALVDAAIELQFGFAELVRRYREVAALASCTPSARELLRRISDDIEKQLAVLDCERTGGSPVVDRDMAWAKKLDAEAVEAGKLIAGLQEDVDELQAEVNRLQVERDILLRIKLDHIAEAGDYDGWPENYPAIKAHDDWLRKNK